MTHLAPPNWRPRRLSSFCRLFDSTFSAVRPLRNASIIPREACPGAYSIIVSYHSITPAGSREFMRIHHCEMTYRCRTTGRHGQHGHAAHRSTQNDEGCSTSHFLFDESLRPSLSSQFFGNYRRTKFFEKLTGGRETVKMGKSMPIQSHHARSANFLLRSIPCRHHQYQKHKCRSKFRLRSTRRQRKARIFRKRGARLPISISHVCSRKS